MGNSGQKASRPGIGIGRKRRSNSLLRPNRETKRRQGSQRYAGVS